MSEAKDNMKAMMAKMKAQLSDKDWKAINDACDEHRFAIRGCSDADVAAYTGGQSVNGDAFPLSPDPYESADAWRAAVLASVCFMRQLKAANVALLTGVKQSGSDIYTGDKGRTLPKANGAGEGAAIVKAISLKDNTDEEALAKIEALVKGDGGK